MFLILNIWLHFVQFEKWAALSMQTILPEWLARVVC